MRLQVHTIVVSRARAYNIVPGSGHRWSSGGGGLVTTSNRFSDIDITTFHNIDIVVYQQTNNSDYLGPRRSF